MMWRVQNLELGYQIKNTEFMGDWPVLCSKMLIICPVKGQLSCIVCRPEPFTLHHSPWNKTATQATAGGPHRWVAWCAFFLCQDMYAHGKSPEMLPIRDDEQITERRQRGQGERNANESSLTTWHGCPRTAFLNFN